MTVMSGLERGRRTSYRISQSPSIEAERATERGMKLVSHAIRRGLSQAAEEQQSRTWRRFGVCFCGGEHVASSQAIHKSAKEREVSANTEERERDEELTINEFGSKNLHHAQHSDELQ